jgi:adenylate cyclase, class 2
VDGYDMNNKDTELEVKFYLSRPAELEQKLIASGAKLVEPRILEVNLRFDTPNFDLLNTGRLLRLRQDRRARVTYKGAGGVEGGARLRQELEFTVSNFDTARALFEALGYQVYTMYEKYRTTYQLEDVEVDLDEMPDGSFMEIEGSKTESIRAIAQKLGLNWEARILASYTELFERVRSQLGLTFRDLSFENFKGLQVNPSVLGVMIAD